MDGRRTPGITQCRKARGCSRLDWLWLQCEKKNKPTQILDLLEVDILAVMIVWSTFCVCSQSGNPFTVHTVTGNCLWLLSHHWCGRRLSSARAQRQALGNVVAVDLAQRRAQGVHAGAFFSRPVGQQRADGVLVLPEDGNALLLVAQESRQVAPVAVVHVAVVPAAAVPEKQLLHLLPGVQREEQARLFIDGHHCRKDGNKTKISSWPVFPVFVIKTNNSIVHKVERQQMICNLPKLVQLVCWSFAKTPDPQWPPGLTIEQVRK